jgi:hypothetical protein
MKLTIGDTTEADHIAGFATLAQAISKAIFSSVDPKVTSFFGQCFVELESNRQAFMGLLEKGMPLAPLKEHFGNECSPLQAQFWAGIRCIYIDALLTDFTTFSTVSPPLRSYIAALRRFISIAGPELAAIDAGIADQTSWSNFWCKTATRAQDFATAQLQPRTEQEWRAEHAVIKRKLLSKKLPELLEMAAEQKIEHDPKSKKDALCQQLADRDLAAMRASEAEELKSMQAAVSKHVAECSGPAEDDDNAVIDPSVQAAITHAASSHSPGDPVPLSSLLMQQSGRRDGLAVEHAYSSFLHARLSKTACCDEGLDGVQVKFSKTLSFKLFANYDSLCKLKLFFFGRLVLIASKKAKAPHAPMGNLPPLQSFDQASSDSCESVDSASSASSSASSGMVVAVPMLGSRTIGSWCFSPAFNVKVLKPDDDPRCATLTSTVERIEVPMNKDLGVNDPFFLDVNVLTVNKAAFEGEDRHSSAQSQRSSE